MNQKVLFENFDKNALEEFAIKLFEKSVAIFKKTEEYNNLKIVYKDISLAYQKMNNPEKANHYKRMAEKI